jgi:hypothetical protein
MAISIEKLIEKASERAFLQALDHTIQAKVEVLLRKAFEDGTTLSNKLEEKIDLGFQRFVQDGVHWEKNETWLQEVKPPSQAADTI